MEWISEEWSCLSGLYTAEEADFMTQLLDFSVPDDAFWPSHHESTLNNSSYYPSTSIVSNNTNLFCFSQGSSSNDIFLTTSTSISSEGTHSFDPSINFSSISMDMGNTNYTSHNSHQTIDDQVSGLYPQKSLLAFQPNQDCETEMLLSESAIEDLDNPPKRFKSSITMEVSENRKNAKSKKNPKSASMSNNEEDSNSGQLFSEDNPNASSLELKRGASSTSSLTPKDLNCKSKANRGPATDPQSLYARRRRERINERLKILQNLVPNGTKVDISTMLEEAVQYVKFLQLQIKLLSSDDMWMYAPIAYNGINIGLDLNIPPRKQSQHSN